MAHDEWTDEQRRTFIASLNTRLPKKRVIAQGIVRNERDEILLCQLTYKQAWDLPGGVVDDAESPAACLEREVREELGVELPARDLITTTWLPPYRGWDDAVLFLFDLGRTDAAFAATLTLQPREIVAVHWCPIDELAAHVAPYTVRLLTSALAEAPAIYLEDGLEPG